MRYQPPIALPNEFALAVACCRWSYSGEDSGRIAELAGQVDWDTFLRTCRRHRVQGLVWHALSELDAAMTPTVRDALAGDAKAIAEHGLRSAAESLRLARMFQEESVPLLFLKGLTIGKIAYGKPFVKMGWDIDLLVSQADVVRAAELLDSLGYRLTLPADIRRLQRWHRSRKESVWTNPGGLVVELHSRVADQPQLLPSVTVASRCQRVLVTPGIELPTLAADALFAYLCVHGASSAWFRLKWISDVAGFLHGRDQPAIEHLRNQAAHLEAGRAIGQALILAHWLFDQEVPASAFPIASADLWLAKTALREMLRGEPTERRLGTSMIHLTQFFLLPGWRYKLAEFGRQAQAAVGLT